MFAELRTFKLSFIKTHTFLFSLLVKVSQDFQDQAIPGQEAKTESSHSSMDSNENWQ